MRTASQLEHDIEGLHDIVMACEDRRDEQKLELKELSDLLAQSQMDSVELYALLANAEAERDELRLRIEYAQGALAGIAGLDNNNQALLTAAIVLLEYGTEDEDGDD